jgi:dicarboxylate carrier protein MatC
MGPEILSIVVLVHMFVIATTMPVNLGALSFVAAFFVGTIAVGCPSTRSSSASLATAR